MGKRKKKKATRSGPQPEAPEVPREMRSRPFEQALKGLKSGPTKATPADRPAPARPSAPSAPSREAPSLSEDDRDALGMAMVGVTPLADRGPRRVVRGTGKGVDSRTAEVAGQAEGGEQRARAKLDALVAAGVSFQVQRNEEYVRGARTGLDPGVLKRLARRRGAADSLDLHGLSQAQARREIQRFVRAAHRQGLDLVCVVHGKGLHSEGGLGVLRELTIDTLTESGCAPCVRAFCTAPPNLGGTGALLVELVRR